MTGGNQDRAQSLEETEVKIQGDWGLDDVIGQIPKQERAAQKNAAGMSIEAPWVFAKSWVASGYCGYRQRLTEYRSHTGKEVQY